MLRVIDARDFLDEEGITPLEPPRVRRLALWVARLIEYGGPLAVGETRETLIECPSRPQRKQCPGLLWVEKTEDVAIVAFCLACKQDHAVIRGWEDSLWATGPVAPVSAGELLGSRKSLDASAAEPSASADTGGGTVHELRITLRDIEPPIWRSVRVPSDLPLVRLHRVLNAAMGWENYHLHEFAADDRRYGPKDSEFPDPELLPERGVRLRELVSEVGSRLVYQYDFGDDWYHDVVVTRILSTQEAGEVPSCLEGARACPPEDCGGAFGYQENLEALRDPRHPQHDEVVQWMGERFNPDRFDPAEANRRVRAVR